MSIYTNPRARPPLEERLYSLSNDELHFFKSQTGIEDEEALKRHIIAVQTKAYESYGYPCIRAFSFTKLKISRLPAYSSALKLLREHEDPILLDIGCCFGNDARKAVADGWPANNVIASDLRQGFWQFGHELFRSTSETFPATFIAGDAFDPAIIAPRAPFTEVPQTPRPALESLTSLTPVQGHVSAIHASSLFHLFDEGRQLELGHQLATLLSPLPGSVIFGSHGGMPEKGVRVINYDTLPGMFCHSPQSWCEMWDGQVFEKGSVKVEAKLHKIADRPDMTVSDAPDFWLLLWSVTRI